MRVVLGRRGAGESRLHRCVGSGEAGRVIAPDPRPWLNCRMCAPCRARSRPRPRLGALEDRVVSSGGGERRRSEAAREANVGVASRMHAESALVMPSLELPPAAPSARAGGRCDDLFAPDDAQQQRRRAPPSSRALLATLSQLLHASRALQDAAAGRRARPREPHPPLLLSSVLWRQGAASVVLPPGWDVVRNISILCAAAGPSSLPLTPAALPLARSTPRPGLSHPPPSLKSPSSALQLHQPPWRSPPAPPTCTRSTPTTSPSPS